MGKREPSKFVEPTALTGEWLDSRETYFWHDRSPWAVKHAMEKMMGVLLDRVSEDEALLTYSGRTSSVGEGRAFRLRFEAMIGERKLYSLQVQSEASQKWWTEEQFLAGAERMFGEWRARLEVPSGEITWERASWERYREVREESVAIAKEAGGQRDDPATVLALQKSVIAGLRAGHSFHSSHKEGWTSICFDGRAFVRYDEGKHPKSERFSREAQLLACVRHFYDGESRRETHPHRPSEVEVWKYILKQLRR
ncbi:MAG: hypothetical protein NTV52_21775 [Acidobacteria bacterium]|nr:hypothetical protein [Acidobacteriota bacterium]